MMMYSVHNELKEKEYDPTLVKLLKEKTTIQDWQYFVQDGALTSEKTGWETYVENNNDFSDPLNPNAVGEESIHRDKKWNGHSDPVHVIENKISSTQDQTRTPSELSKTSSNKVFHYDFDPAGTAILSWKDSAETDMDYYCDLAMTTCSLFQSSWRRKYDNLAEGIFEYQSKITNYVADKRESEFYEFTSSTVADFRQRNVWDGEGMLSDVEVDEGGYPVPTPTFRWKKASTPHVSVGTEAVYNTRIKDLEASFGSGVWTPIPMEMIMP